MSALRLHQVSKSYDTGPQRLEVLREVSLELQQGQALAITGPSGSGKSTLLHIVGTLDEPTSGRVTIDGVEPHAMNEPELARFRNDAIGFVFQDTTCCRSTPCSKTCWYRRWSPGAAVTAPPSAPASCWNASAWARGWSTGRPSCRAASGNAWRWRGR